MAMDAGNSGATAGMAKTIFDKVLPVLTASTDYSNLEAADKAIIEDKWKQISHAISEGIIDHMIPNMEINGVTVETPAADHIETVSGGAGAPAVGVPNPAPKTRVQNNDGTGLIA